MQSKKQKQNSRDGFFIGELEYSLGVKVLRLIDFVRVYRDLCNSFKCFSSDSGCMGPLVDSKAKTIANVTAVLHISRRTMEKHIETIYAKLGVEKRTAALLKAVEQLKH
jgi:hypothetical protein